MKRSRTLLLAVALVLTVTALAGVALPSASASASCPLGPCSSDASCMSICCAAGFCPYIPPDEGPVCRHDVAHNCNRCLC